MDDLNKGFTSSTSIKPSSATDFLFSDAGGNNENLPSQEMVSKLKNPKKQLPTKHFMAPTISAASKAAAPRKKILAERNEADVELRASFSKSWSTESKTPELQCVVDDDVVPANSVADPSLLPYDPIKNYLSPRPKFLRYNPNRRRRILLRQEDDNAAKKQRTSFDTSKPSSKEELGSDSSTTDFSSPEESVEEGEGKIEKVIDEADDEEGEEGMEEVEEDRRWSFRGFLEFLLVMVALIITTLSISSMNTPTPSPVLEALRSFKDPYSRTRGTVYEAAGMNFSEVGSVAVGPWMQTESILEVLGKKKMNYGLDEQSMTVDKERLVETIDELVEVQNRHTEGVGQVETGSHKEEVETGSHKEVSAESEEVEEDVERGLGEGELWSKGHSDQLKGSEVGEREEVENIEPVDQEGVLHQLQEPAVGEVVMEVHEIEAEIEGSEVGEREEVENIESVDLEGVLHQLQEPAVGEEVMEVHEIEAEIEVTDHQWGKDLNTEDGEIEKEGSVANEADNQPNFYGEMGLKEMKENLVEKEVVVVGQGGVDGTDMKSTETTKALNKSRLDSLLVAASVGVSVLILALLSFFHCLKQKKSSPPPAETMVPKENITVENKIRKSEPFARCSSLIHPTAEKEIVNSASPLAPPMAKEVSTEVSHIRAPTVELLGEFVIGGRGEASSSIRSCGMKASNVSIEGKERDGNGRGEASSSIRSCGMKASNVSIEGKESNVSISHSKNDASSIHSGAVSSSHPKASHLELSTADSHSYGCFTAEKKIVKKQRGKNSELSSMVMASPVRRSSRIQNRSVMSP